MRDAVELDKVGYDENWKSRDHLPGDLCSLQEDDNNSKWGSNEVRT